MINLSQFKHFTVQLGTYALLELGLIPIGMLLAWIYGVSYSFPGLKEIVIISFFYWVSLITPAVMRWLGTQAERLLGDVWIEISNEVEWFVSWATNGEVIPTPWARLRAILFLMGTIGSFFLLISIVFNYTTIQYFFGVVWASVVLSIVEHTSKNAR